MNLFDRIVTFFKKGGDKLGMVEKLETIADHTKIKADRAEYERIHNSLTYYKNEFPKVKFLNSNRQWIERNQSTINIMKTVANEYATLVFNEECEISVDGDAASKFVDEVFNHNDFKKNLSDYLEPMFALGGLACKPYINRNSNVIEFTWALADSFYPLESNSNKISECAIPFKRMVVEGKKKIYYTLLEFHEWKQGMYVVTNELYRSEDSKVVGVQVPLSNLYDPEELNEVTEFKTLSRPLFSYLKPNGFNNINPYSPLGLGVCDNAKHTLDRINHSYDQFDQEINKGKRRVAISEMLIKTDYDKNTGQPRQYFDDQEDVFQVIPGGNLDDYTLKDLTTDIRSAAYISAINYHIKTLEMETNLSAGTFAFDGEGLRSTKTATEVVSENSQTYKTRGMQIKDIEKFIKELIISVCELGKEAGLYAGDIPKYDKISVSFDDGAFQDRDAQLKFYMNLHALGYPVEKVFESVLKLTEEEAKKIYMQGLRNEVESTTGIFQNEGLGPEME